MSNDSSSTERPVVSLVSLGCAKNTVDSEKILGKLVEAGFLIAEDPADADLCLVNTCGFIHDAREESAGVLRDLQKLKRGGKLQSVVALGCLVERAQGADELNAFLKHADAQIGFQDYPKLAEICTSLSKSPSTPDTRHSGDGVPVTIGDKRFGGLAAKSFTASYNEFLAAPRLRVGSQHLAYLKISEGCSNFCKFCSIPYIRGVQVSRPMEDIVAEARQLVESGAKEIGLIAQDTSSYGRDLYRESRLVELLKALSAGAGSAQVWFRVMYAFPRFLEDSMLDVIATDPKFCPYIDMPLQHIADKMLADMGRGMLKKETVALLDRIREKMPGGAIRTTFIVGYPGETEEQFQELLDFVGEGRFSHVGAFLYSKEPKTPSAQLADNVPLSEKKRRRDALMRAQLDVSRKRLAGLVGREVEIMVDGPVGPGTSFPKGAVAVGRSRLEAPEVDGVIFIQGKKAASIEPGTLIKARIDKALDYDLLASPVR
ncbi:MAG TPA: 30S ribosomal protein S12 methylthiotransferase RimO [Kiritimatiellia bacterium]